MAFDASTYGTFADTTADAYGIPRSIFRSLINKESGWNPFATGSIDEYGLTQLRPSTAQEVGVNIYDPFDNIRGGAIYLSRMFKKFGNWPDALAAYNGGTGGMNSSQARAYSSDVLSKASSQPLDLGTIPGTNYNAGAAGSLGTSGFDWSQIFSGAFWSQSFASILGILAIIGLILFGLYRMVTA